jgi:eukaryotic-like serine/threonine-protein kinase
MGEVVETVIAEETPRTNRRRPGLRAFRSGARRRSRRVVQRDMATFEVGGRYDLFEVLGTGGSCIVYRAFDRVRGHDVALKVMNHDHASSPEARERFEREVSWTRALAGRGVPVIYDHGLTADRRPYLTLELLSGETLAQRIGRDARLSPSEILRILAPVCRVLARAHAMGLVHRDIKPPNVLLAEDGRVFVLDFGAAKDLGSELSEVTALGAMVGTPRYMSPEQIHGQSNVGPASDLFALGILVYECLTGRPPFDARALTQLVGQISLAVAPPPSTLAPDRAGPLLDGWMHKALARQPSDRFANAGELYLALAYVVRSDRVAPLEGALP